MLPLLPRRPLTPASPAASPQLPPRRATLRQRRDRRLAATAAGSGASSGGESGSLNFRASVSLNVAASEFAKGGAQRCWHRLEAAWKAGHAALASLCSTLL